MQSFLSLIINKEPLLHDGNLLKTKNPFPKTNTKHPPQIFTAHVTIPLVIYVRIVTTRHKSLSSANIWEL